MLLGIHFVNIPHLCMSTLNSVIHYSMSAAHECVCVCVCCLSSHCSAEPTKLDHDVLLALCDAEIDAEQYPCVDRWRQLVQSHSNEEQSRYEHMKHTWCMYSLCFEGAL